MNRNFGIVATTVLMLLIVAFAPMMPSSDAVSEKLDITSVNYRNGEVTYTVETDLPYLYVTVLDLDGKLVYLGPNPDVKNGMCHGKFTKELEPGTYTLKVQGQSKEIFDLQQFVVYKEVHGTYIQNLSAKYDQGIVTFSAETDCPYVYVQIRDLQGKPIYLGPCLDITGGQVNDSFPKPLADGKYILWMQGDSKDITKSVIFDVENGKYVPVDGVDLDKSYIELEVGERTSIKATVFPADATESTVTWMVSDPSIVSYDGDGMFTAKYAGTATVTASCGAYSASCVVVVKGEGSASLNEDGSTTVKTTDVVESGGIKTETENSVTKKDDTVLGSQTVIKITDTNTGVSSEAKQTTDATGATESIVNVNLTSDYIDSSKLDAMIAQATAASEGMKDTKLVLNVNGNDNEIFVDGSALKSAEYDSIKLGVGASVVEIDKKIANSVLNGSVNLKIEDKQVQDIKGVSMISSKQINLSVGDLDVHELGGNVKLHIECEIPEGYSAGDIRAWFVGDDGTLTPVSCEWVDGKAVLDVTHFSTYVVGVERSDTELGNNAIVALAIATIAAIAALYLCYLWKKL